MKLLSATDGRAPTGPLQGDSALREGSVLGPPILCPVTRMEWRQGNSPIFQTWPGDPI